MIVFFKKSKNHGWYPIDEEGKAYCKRRKAGTVLKTESKQEHNYLFHQKLMCLFAAIHEHLPPPVPVQFMGREVTPAHTFDNTRKYLTIKAGYYVVNGFPNGSVRVEAQSLSYASMDDEEKEKLFSAVIDAGLKALPSEWSDAELERVANEILRFE